MAAPRRWLRLDVTWEDSEWLDALDGTAAGCWPRLLCWVASTGRRGTCRAPSLSVLARRWRVPVEAVEALVEAAKTDGALSEEGEMWIITGWQEYQEPDPTAAKRNRKHRVEKSRLSPLRVESDPTTRNAVTDRNGPRARDLLPQPLTPTTPPIPTPTDNYNSRGSSNVENSGNGVPTSGALHSIGSVALEAHRILGMGLWGDELSSRYTETCSLIRRQWVADGRSLADLYAAIHGLRLMVDRGDIEWLADRKQKPLDGLHVLVRAEALIPGPDGRNRRPLYAAAIDAYYRQGEEKHERGVTTGMQRVGELLREAESA